MKKQLLLIFLTFLALTTSGQTIKDGDIYYSLNTDNNTATVVAGAIKYSGSITIPECVTYEGVQYTITSVGNNCFYECTDLSSIILPNTITTLGKWSFCNTGIKTIELPVHLSSLGTGTFSNCKNLESVIVHDELQYISGTMVFFACTSLKSLELPGIIGISSTPFEHCHSLTSVVFGENLSYINGSAFVDCGNLSDVYCYAINAPQISASAFESVDKITLHVPTEAIESYKTTLPWSEFGNIISINDNTESSKCDPPIFTYEKGKIKLSCNTPDVEFVTRISCSDINTYEGDEIDLSLSYVIKAQATKIGYLNSDVVEATMCWIDADPKTEGFSNGIVNVRANPVLIQSNENILFIRGATLGTPICVYDISGRQVGSSIVVSDSTLINTNLTKGQIAVIRIGEESVKIIIK